MHMPTLLFIIILLVLPVLWGCNEPGASFNSDIKFLKDHVEVVVLKDSDSQAKVAIVPAYQGRVMTSTSDGKNSFGWINRDVIAKGFLSQEQIKDTLQEHIYVFGGEDRFWLGPEGGQYAIFFGKDDPFDFEHWQTPAVIDTEAYDLLSRTETSAVFTKKTTIKNYAGTTFDLRIDRKINLLTFDEAKTKLGIELPDSLKMVAYESVNAITNTGKNAWQKRTGLLSIWILGMFKHSPQTVVVIPFSSGPEDKLGPKVNDTYFGKVPADRLLIKDDVLFFKGDGQYRSKIGLSNLRAKDTLGSYDGINKVLTIVQYNKNADAVDFVNSMWEHQKEPFGGDVINSYNDGPVAGGEKPLGPFYELETSSPAAALKPNKSLYHVHRTFHIRGPQEHLDRIAKEVLGVSLEQINNAFEHK